MPQLIIIFWKVADSWPRSNSNHSYNPRFSLNQVIYEIQYDVRSWYLGLQTDPLYLTIYAEWRCTWTKQGNKQHHKIQLKPLKCKEKTKHNLIVIIIEIAEVLICLFFVKNSVTDVCHAMSCHAKMTRIVPPSKHLISSHDACIM